MGSLPDGMRKLEEGVIATTVTDFKTCAIELKLTVASYENRKLTFRLVPAIFNCLRSIKKLSWVLGDKRRVQDCAVGAWMWCLMKFVCHCQSEHGTTKFQKGRVVIMMLEKFSLWTMKRPFFVYSWSIEKRFMTLKRKREKDWPIVKNEFS